jgi:hypothetical protein
VSEMAGIACANVGGSIIYHALRDVCPSELVTSDITSRVYGKKMLVLPYILLCELSRSHKW